MIFNILLYRLKTPKGRKWNMSWETEKTPEVQKMMGNGGDHVLCTTVYVRMSVRHQNPNLTVIERL